MLEVINAFELWFGDGTHLCRMQEGPAKQPCGYTSVQVAAAFLDARNLPCNFLPPTQESEGWNVLRNMLINLINEDRVSAVGVASGAGGPGEETSWLARCTVMTSFVTTRPYDARRDAPLSRRQTRHNERSSETEVTALSLLFYYFSNLEPATLGISTSVKALSCFPPITGNLNIATISHLASL
jgi:hypothetical protein